MKNIFIRVSVLSLVALQPVSSFAMMNDDGNISAPAAAKAEVGKRPNWCERYTSSLMQLGLLDAHGAARLLEVYARDVLAAAKLAWDAVEHAEDAARRSRDLAKNATDFAQFHHEEAVRAANAVAAVSAASASSSTARYAVHAATVAAEAANDAENDAAIEAADLNAAALVAAATENAYKTAYNTSRNGGTSSTQDSHKRSFDKMAEEDDANEGEAGDAPAAAASVPNNRPAKLVRITSDADVSYATAATASDATSSTSTSTSTTGRR